VLWELALPYWSYSDGRLDRSEELAPMALAVRSNRVSAYVTGAAIVVDGGLSLTNWFDPPALDDLS
jgi:3-oxoacyl-[acyl-carrier protein] reductase